MSLLKFRPKTPVLPPRAGAPPPGPAVKYGLYPVGDEVLMSIPAFEVIVHMLMNGTPEERQELSTVLRRMYNSPFVGTLAD
jgi:hypothetical protein